MSSGRYIFRSTLTGLVPVPLATELHRLRPLGLAHQLRPIWNFPPRRPGFPYQMTISYSFVMSFALRDGRWRIEELPIEEAD